MNLNIVAVVLVGVAGVGAGIGGLVAKLNEPPLICIDMLRKLANELPEKMVMPNADGGLVLVSPGINPDDVRFTSYVGRKTAPKLKELLVSSGLKNVSVSVGETCETESGIEYTVVRGSYTVPQEEPESEPI